MTPGPLGWPDEPRPNHGRYDRHARDDQLPGTGAETTSDDDLTSTVTGHALTTTGDDGPMSTAPAATGDLPATTTDSPPDPSEIPTDAGCGCRQQLRSVRGWPRGR
jgi:hypothetical protein